MYGATTSWSYGSYSSISAPTAAGPSGSGSSAYLGARRHETSYTCAFPSWPRRVSLGEADSERASAYLSDEDLFLPTTAADPFEDSDARSVSSAGSSSGEPHMLAAAPAPTDEELDEMERERLAYQREVVRYLMDEKERRRKQYLMQQQAFMRRPRRGNSSSSSSPPSAAACSSSVAVASASMSPSSLARKSRLGAMTPIAEAE